jgi:hypothetical protein
MHIGLREEADLAVIAVHQNQLLVVAGDDSVIGFQVIHAALRSLVNKISTTGTHEAWARLGPNYGHIVAVDLGEDVPEGVG